MIFKKTFFYYKNKLIGEVYYIGTNLADWGYCSLDKKIKDTEAKMNMAGSNYGDPQQQELAGELSQDLEKLKAKREKLAGGSDKNETKVINGVKYKPIKESKKHILKENYDRIFRSRK